MGSTYFRNFLARAAFYMPILIYIVVLRMTLEDEASPAQALVLSFFGFCLVELSVYINMKAKARLFLKVKTTELQERQLADLLDAVPDNVFICRKDSNEGSQSL